MRAGYRESDWVARTLSHNRWGRPLGLAIMVYVFAYWGLASAGDADLGTYDGVVPKARDGGSFTGDFSTSKICG